MRDDVLMYSVLTKAVLSIVQLCVYGVLYFLFIRIRFHTRLTRGLRCKPRNRISLARSINT